MTFDTPVVDGLSSPTYVLSWPTDLPTYLPNGKGLLQRGLCVGLARGRYSRDDGLDVQ